MMQKSRRNFMTYMSILGISSFAGFSLTASTQQASPISLSTSQIDNDAFDPDGWL
jgi:ABC-type Fe3+-siderophore transport system permease subunit